MKRKRWAKSFGPYGCRVRVYQTTAGVFYMESRTKRGSRRRSLGHRDRERAEREAREEQARLELGLTVVNDPTPTVGRVFAAYREATSPDKSKASQGKDRRCAELWARFLGEDKDVSALSDTEWRKFARQRKSGEIDSRGKYVPPSKRDDVRSRTVGSDQEWLRAVLLWAVRARDPDGRYYLRENPIRGFAIAREKNPRRPVATQDRFEKIQAVADKVHPDLRDIFDIENGTGRRLSAVLQLRYENWRPDHGPKGSITWPADTDKLGKEWLAPVNEQVRAAIERIIARRPGIGRAYLFPSPRNRERPVSKDRASQWLKRAEKLAEVPKMDGSLWHAYRRKWSTERKHLPDRDVAAAGGWSDLTSLRTCYQQVDDATLYVVVSQPAELREAIQ